MTPGAAFATMGDSIVSSYLGKALDAVYSIVAVLILGLILTGVFVLPVLFVVLLLQDHKKTKDTEAYWRAQFRDEADINCR